MSYSIDQFGIIRDQFGIIVPQDEGDARYQAYSTWLFAGGLCEVIVSVALREDLNKYKTAALQRLLDRGDTFVKGLTSDLLDCEIQSFPKLVDQAKLVKLGETGKGVRQIFIQANMTNKTPDQVAERVLLLDEQMDAVVPIMSGMRQNASMLIDACLTHEQVDIVSGQILANARVIIGKMMALVADQGGI